MKKLSIGVIALGILLSACSKEVNGISRTHTDPVIPQETKMSFKEKKEVEPKPVRNTGNRAQAFNDPDPTLMYMFK